MKVDPPFNPNEEMKKWPLYRVASMKEVGGTMDIRTIRAPHIMEVHGFLKRCYRVENVGDLEFLEIHSLLPGGRVALVHESRKPWPSNVKETNYTGIIVPKIPKDNKHSTSVHNITDEQRKKGEERINALVSELVDKAVTVQPANSIPEEEGRPKFPYKIEVA